MSAIIYLEKRKDEETLRQAIDKGKQHYPWIDKEVSRFDCSLRNVLNPVI